MPTFDVVNRIDKAEVQNAHQQAMKELAQRYDFKGTDTTIERTEEGFYHVRNGFDQAIGRMGNGRQVRRKRLDALVVEAVDGKENAAQ